MNINFLQIIEHSNVKDAKECIFKKKDALSTITEVSISETLLILGGPTHSLLFNAFIFFISLFSKIICLNLASIHLFLLPRPLLIATIVSQEKREKSNATYKCYFTVPRGPLKICLNESFRPLSYSTFT